MDPISEHPFHAMVKIDVKDQSFQDKLLQLSYQKNIRLDYKKRGFLNSILNGGGLTISLIEEKDKIYRLGYLEDYILQGFVYQFDNESDAEEFASTAKDVLSKFLNDKSAEYLRALNSRYNEI